MDLVTKRRRFLELAGTGGALALAGCTAPTPEGNLADSETDLDEMATVTVALEVDQDALQTAREELVSQIENGTVNQTEAQEQFYATEADLLSKAATSFQERAAENEALSVKNSAAEIGVLLVSGTPTALIESLGRTEVRGLFTEETFEQALAQQNPAE